MHTKTYRLALTLNTEAKKDQTGKFRLSVFLFGGSQSSVTSGELTLTLGPPPPPSKTAQPEQRETLSQQFVNAIKQAAEGIKAADPKQLKLQKLRAQFKFVVQKDGIGGVKYEIVPLSIDLSRGAAETAAHTVELVFALPK